MESWKEELYHHGILGQKWGKRNGPPYPLGSGDHSSSEKKAGWRKSLSGGSEIKDRRNKRRREIQDRYDKEIERIEAPYKRGDTLSEKDVKRQNAAADRYDADWKKNDARYKAEKELYNYNKFAGLAMKARSKYRDRINSKYDKKMSRAKSDVKALEQKRKNKLSEYDSNTELIKKGMNQYRKVITNYRNAQIKQIDSPNFKNSNEYKIARNVYAMQRAVSLYYGKVYPTAAYTVYNQYKENKSKRKKQ